MSHPACDALLKMLSARHPLSAGASEALGTRFEPWSSPAGARLVQPGDMLDKVLFVERGLLRFYTVDPEGHEWNKGFAAEGELTGPLSGDAPHWPMPYGIEALEAVQGLWAPAKMFRVLCATYPELGETVRGYLARMLEEKALRLEELQRLDATRRYQAFLARSPLLAQRLPQYHIASYLGISEISLSRIRGNLGLSTPRD